jgi:translation initiation factor 1 (eIF-1/SUI1)
MSYQLVYGTVRESLRRAIYVVRVQNAALDPMQADDIAERMREWLQSRGEMVADVVVTQGDSRETLRFFGHSYSISLVRAALFNAAVSWTPIELG